MHINWVCTDFMNLPINCVISSFLREVDEKCALLGYYGGSCGNFILMFRYNLSVPSSRVLEDGTDRLSGNVGKKLPQLVAS
jgi:hypothetical protein